MKRIVAAVLVLAAVFSVWAGAAKAELYEMRCLGTPSDTSVLITLVNETGKRIDQLWLAAGGQEELPAVELLNGDVIAPGERFGVWLEQREDVAAELCDLSIGFDDGTLMTLHGIDTKEFKEASLRCDVNVAFLTYTSLISGAPVSTWLDELKHLEQKESVDFPVLENTLQNKTDESEYAS